MTSMIEIQNGDMIGMAKVVNGNTVMLDKRITAAEKNIKELGKCHNGYVKHSSKSIKRLCFAGMLTAIGGIVLAKEIGKLEKKVKKLEDQMVYNEYMREDAGDDCK